MKYLFILGRKRLISVAEICAVFGEKCVEDISREAAILDLPFECASPKDTLDQLGGTIKLCRIFEEGGINQTTDIVGEFLKEKFQGIGRKVKYGISVYSFPHKHENFLKLTLKNSKKLVE